ncbi:MAG: ThuA domain-containing protein [Balneolaceae bacterium]|nr:ThuA domain-containing protein [Balneolaceae bacterium]
MLQIGTTGRTGQSVNRELVSGGARSHPPYQEIKFQVVNSNHPITKGVPKNFDMQDELYRFENNPNGPDMNVLVKGIEPESGEEFPVVWTVKREGGPIVCFTFGHDGKAHYHYAYRTILKNSIGWLHNN